MSAMKIILMLAALAFGAALLFSLAQGRPAQTSLLIAGGTAFVTAAATFALWAFERWVEGA